MAKKVTTNTVNPQLTGIDAKTYGSVGYVRRNNKVYNVLVILLDDIGIDKLDPAQWPEYAIDGVPASATYAWLPSLRQLADEGMIFRYAYAEPWCGPTRTSLLTGRSNDEHGFAGNFNQAVPYPLPHPDGNDSIDAGVPHPFSNGAIREHTWANFLLDTHPAGSAGDYYRRQVFGKWHLSGADAAFNSRTTIIEAHGFSRCNIHQGNLGNDPMLSNPRDHYNFATNQSTKSSGPTVVTVRAPPYDEAHWCTSFHGGLVVSFINQNTTPFVCYWAPNAPHAPQQVAPHSLISGDTINNNRYTDTGYDDPLPSPDGTVIDEDLFPERAIQAYEAGIEAVDSLIGAMIYGNPTPGGTTSTQISSPISSANLENTIIIVLGDNGTLREAVRWPYNPDQAKGDVFELGTRVPMIVKAPPSLMPQAGLVCEHPIFVTDIFATIEEVTRSTRYANASEANPRSGRSFLRLLGDPEGAPTRTTITTSYFVPSGILGTTTYIYTQVSSLTGVTWDPDTLRLTKTGAFSAYTWEDGDIFDATGGTGVATGYYEIAAKVDSNTIELRKSLAEDVTADIAGSAQRPTVLSEYITMYRATSIPGKAKYMFKKEPDGSTSEHFYRLDLDPLESEDLIATEGNGSIENLSNENKAYAKSLKAATDIKWKL